MTFRQFLEQGTKVSMTGHGAGGRAGQKQFTPERMKGSLPVPQVNPAKDAYKGPKTQKVILPRPLKVGKL
jgi:hypothetical protein